MNLIKANTLKDYTLNSLNGDIGKVKEFYFDDHHWTIRYLVAETGNWLADRQVLISPHALLAVYPAEQYIAIDLTREQIENSPDLNNDKPVSRQFEESYSHHYGLSSYWDGPYVWGSSPWLENDRTKRILLNESTESWDPHLRSTHDVIGHHIQAKDSEIGHVEDFIIDDQTWTIRYLVINTHNWWPGKRVLLSPLWIESVSWAQSKVFVNLLSETIKQSPEYKQGDLINRDYETDLHQYYDRQSYWVDELAAQAHLYR